LVTRLVVDTSVAVKWVVPEFGQPEDDTELALEMLDHAMIAPDCIVGEFANALFKKVQRQEIGEQQARAAVGILTDIVDVAPSPPLIAAAFELSLQLVHPVHDCMFLALALETNRMLVTADMKFVEKCVRLLPHPPLVSLVEYRSSTNV
jgi:predicted nucleic acid-binding protein